MRRTLTSAGMLCAVAAVIAVVGGAPTRAQSPAPVSSSRATEAAAAPAGWIAPRTPWGDPDIQGVFTTDDELGVPFERPAELGTRDTLTDEEFAAREAQARRQAEAERARQEAAAEAAVEASAKTAFDAFMAEAGAEEWVARERLVANPFIYEDDTVLVWIKFYTMLASDQALFNMGRDPFLVSGVPTGTFTQEGQSVLLAGRVAGKEYVKLPVVGEVLVPHLEYVDAHICQQPQCGEMLAWDVAQRSYTASCGTKARKL